MPMVVPESRKKLWSVIVCADAGKWAARIYPNTQQRFDIGWKFPANYEK